MSLSLRSLGHQESKVSVRNGHVDNREVGFSNLGVTWMTSAVAATAAHPGPESLGAQTTHKGRKRGAATTALIG